MNKSLEAVLECLRQFDAPGFREDHEALAIAIPQGLLRYHRLSESGGITDQMTVRLTYRDRKLSFAVSILERSKLRTAPVIERSEGAGEFQQSILRLPLELSLGDARRLFFYLLEEYRCFKISVKTIKRKHW